MSNNPNTTSTSLAPMPTKEQIEDEMLKLKNRLDRIDYAKLDEKLLKAKTSLVLGHTFFGTIALNMSHTVMRPTDSWFWRIPTAATTGQWVRYNPLFIEDLSADEMLFLVAHECCHPMFGHMYRLKGRDAKLWNQAGDYVINELLCEENLGSMIEGGLRDTSIYNAGNGVTDNIYELLRQQDGKGGGKGDGDGGIGGDLIGEEGMTQEEAEAKEGEWREIVAQAAQAAKMCGNLSANLERFVDKFVNPLVPWEDVLKDFVEKQRSDERSYARPNRRFLSQGMYMPSITGESLGEIFFAIDCSGSIGMDELTQFASEMQSVKEDCNPTKMHVVYFDSSISHYECYERDDELAIRPHGGGGTDFAPIFEYMREHDINPVAVIVLTDLCCHSFGTPPECPVLWVSNHSNEAPWGQVVMMKDTR